MKRSLLDKWLKALESGKFKQRAKMLGNAERGYCCLGVLCLVAKQDFDWSDYTLPAHFADEVGMDVAGSSFWNEPDASLTIMNDRGDPFEKIAAVIRENPKRFIKSIE